MSINRIKLALLILFVSFHSSAKPEQMLIAHLDHPGATLYVDYIKKSYADIGIEAKFIPISTTRRLHATNQGIFDAVIASLPSIRQSFPNLLQVGPMIGHFSQQLLCKQNTACNIRVLHDQSITLYATHGALRVLDGELKIQHSANMYLIEEEAQLMNMLSLGRINYLIETLSDLNQFEHITKNYQKVELGHYKAFHHIHKKHAGIADKLSQFLTNNIDIIEPYIKQ